MVKTIHNNGPRLDLVKKPTIELLSNIQIIVGCVVQDLLPLASMRIFFSFLIKRTGADKY